MRVSCRSCSGPSRSGRGDRAMTNLRKLATIIYETGDSERILAALGSLLEVGLNQGNDVSEEFKLLGSQITIGHKTETEKKAS